MLVIDAVRLKLRAMFVMLLGVMKNALVLVGYTVTSLLC